jgi:hypothetical protein
MSARVIRSHDQGGRLQRVQRRAGVAVGPVDQVGDGVVVGAEAEVAEPAALLGQRPAHDQLQVARGQRLQPEQQAAADQRRVDGEERVLGGGADQDHGAVLDAGQQRVLLGPVEAVDLVDEQDRAPPARPEPLPGPLEHGPDVLDARAGRAQLLELRPGGAGDDLGQGGLAGARRAPEHDRAQLVGLDQGAQAAPGAEHVALADVLVEGGRAHPGGEGRGGGADLLRPGREEVHGHESRGKVEGSTPRSRARSASVPAP